MKKDHGLTLLELIIVIFIISVFLASVSPSFYTFIEGEDKSEPKRMASIIRYLNDSAINTKETFNITFDFASGTVSYRTAEGEREETFKVISSVKIPSRGDIRHGQLTLLFGPAGYPEPFNVYFKGESYVAYNPFSRRIRVERQ